MSFKLKTIILFILTSLIPYLILITYIVYKTQEQVIKEIEKDLSFDLELITDRIDNRVEEIYQDFIFISKLSMMNDVLSEDIDKQITTALQRKKDNLNLVGDYFVVNLKNRVIASSNINAIGKELNLKEIKTKFKTDIVASFNNKKIGEFYLNFKVENLKDFLKTREEKVAFLYDRGFKKYLFKTNDTVENIIKFKELDSVKNLMEKITKSKQLNSLKYLDVYVSINKDSALKAYKDIEFVLILSIFGGVFLITIVSIYFASKIISPIKELSDTAITIANTKDYSKRVYVSSKDEIGALAEAFNKMVESVQSALKKLQLESENKIMLSEERAKSKMLENLSKKLSKYLSPQIYNSIFTGKQDVKLESKRKKLTIFFSDIVGFTETTDTMESEDLAELLNHYLNEMSKIGLHSGATIDKFIGDAILAFFGDPESRGIKEDALACVDMALKMKRKIIELEKYWHERGFSRAFKVRIGINTGYLTVGNFGSEDRMDYTIIGGAVNLASRIESIAKPNEIWISEETHLLIKDKIFCEEMDEISVKGIKHPIKVYRVIDYFENLNEDKIFKEKIDKFLLEIEPKLKENETELKEIEEFLEKRLLKPLT